VLKARPIMYASHRDACILSKYAHDLTALLDAHYAATQLSDNVIGYRKLGRANYDFAAAACQFAHASAPCVVMCFDVTGFFDHLDHSILKGNLKQILKVDELSRDWFAVFRHVTRYKYINRVDMETHPVFDRRLKAPSHAPVATISEIKSAGIRIHENKNKYGVPQGTPISAAFSSLYMLDFDRTLTDACAKIGALYQRYSDDVIVICGLGYEHAMHALVQSTLVGLKLNLSSEKTDIVKFAGGTNFPFQYLGFDISPAGAVVRASSMSCQWRNLKRSVRRTKEAGKKAIATGKATKIYTKNLRKKFAPIGSRNFSSYTRNAADALGSEKLLSQVRRWERAADIAIRGLNK
jgi:RNA-directed DNA polymerase